MNNKGIFFKTLAILILTLFVISFSLYSDVQERTSVQKRVQTMNSFLKSIEDDIPRQLYISGFRTIFRMEKRIIETGNYILPADFDRLFKENFFNGTMEGVENLDLMSGATFPDLQQKTQEKADKVNVYINITSPNLTITQSDPWNLRIELTTDLVLVDKNQLASWNKTETYVGFVPINGFEDPLYLIGTNGKYANKFNQSSTLLEFVDVEGNYSKYWNNTDAPSFIGRLTGDLAPSIYGVESLVNLESLSDAGVNVLDKTIVDHYYFSNQNPPISCTVDDISWAKIDGDHTDYCI